MNVNTLQFDAAFQKISSITGGEVILDEVELASSGPFDGRVRIEHSGSSEVRYFELKRNLTKSNLVHRQVWKASTTGGDQSLILLSNYISPSIRALLREQKIQFIDEAANCYLCLGKNVILIEGQKTKSKSREDSRARVFQKAGLKLILQILFNETQFETTFRELVARSSISIGSAHYVMDGLIGMGFIAQVDRNQYRILKRKELFVRWVEAYDTSLRPAISRGRYVFAIGEEKNKWASIYLGESSFWSGMSAVAKTGKIVQPSAHILYTNLPNRILRNAFHIVENQKGDLEILNCFWRPDLMNADVEPVNQSGSLKSTSGAPAPIVYADLVRVGDARLNEIAQGVLSEYLNGYN